MSEEGFFSVKGIRNSARGIVCFSFCCLIVCALPLIIVGFIFSTEYRDKCVDAVGTIYNQLPTWLLVISIYNIISPFFYLPFLLFPNLTLRTCVIFTVLGCELFKLAWEIYGIILVVGTAGTSCVTSAEPLRVFVIVLLVLSFLAKFGILGTIRTLASYELPGDSTPVPGRKLDLDNKDFEFVKEDIVA